MCDIVQLGDVQFGPEAWGTKAWVMEVTTLSAAHIDRLEAEGKFPERHLITEGRVIWIKEQVYEWMRQRIGSKEPLVCEIEKAKNKARRQGKLKKAA
jgi:predicted DNA-binding transcriptional regulator AlpA